MIDLRGRLQLDGYSIEGDERSDRTGRRGVLQTVRPCALLLTGHLRPAEVLLADTPYGQPYKYCHATLPRRACQQLRGPPEGRKRGRLYTDFQCERRSAVDEKL